MFRVVVACLPLPSPSYEQVIRIVFPDNVPADQEVQHLWLNEKLPLNVLTLMQRDLLNPTAYLGDDVVRFLLGELQLLNPRRDILFLNACETLAAVVPANFPKVLVVVPDRVRHAIVQCYSVCPILMELNPLHIIIEWRVGHRI